MLLMWMTLRGHAQASLRRAGPLLLHWIPRSLESMIFLKGTKNWLKQQVYLIKSLGKSGTILGTEAGKGKERGTSESSMRLTYQLPGSRLRLGTMQVAL